MSNFNLKTYCELLPFFRNCDTADELKGRIFEVVGSLVSVIEDTREAIGAPMDELEDGLDYAADMIRDMDNT